MFPAVWPHVLPLTLLFAVPSSTLAFGGGRAVGTSLSLSLPQVRLASQPERHSHSAYPPRKAGCVTGWAQMVTVSFSAPGGWEWDLLGLFVLKGQLR